MIFPFVRMNVEKIVPVSSPIGPKFPDPCANENMIGVRGSRNAKANEIPRDLTIDRKSFNGE